MILNQTNKKTMEVQMNKVKTGTKTEDDGLRNNKTSGAI
jgi:hypothetical protein